MVAEEVGKGKRRERWDRGVEEWGGVEVCCSAPNTEGSTQHDSSTKNAPTNPFLTETLRNVLAP